LENTGLIQMLVVEDDQLIQAMVEDALSEGGFKPVLAQTGEEAAELLLEAVKYAALITDINLPGSIDGWEVAKRAREAHPQMPVVYITGAAAEQWPSKGVPNSVLLNKPFAPAQIVTAVSQLLNATPPAPPE
jgi:DNA-binding response OmpR family regulator